MAVVKYDALALSMEEMGQLMNDLAPLDSCVPDISSPPIQEMSESRRTPGATTGRVALVVDDDPFFRVALSTILTEIPLYPFFSKLNSP